MHNRATICRADGTDLSGWVTANEVRLDRFHNGIRKVCALVGATLILPALAYAEDNQGNKRLAALEAKVAALQTQVDTDASQIAALQNQLRAAQPVLNLAPFISVDPNPENGVIGPHITFKGANLHIVSGSGATDDNLSTGGTLTGLGNLIIGYDEMPGPSPGARGGSHNLVIGRFHKFNQAAFGGLVAGRQNTIGNEGANVSGGTGNTASGRSASVSGGANNTAGGQWSVVIGGLLNTANNNNSIAPNPPFP